MINAFGSVVMVDAAVGVRLFCSDIDGTLVGSREALDRFAAAWSAIPKSDRPLLCYNTGRLVDDVLALTRSSNLPRSDFILGGVGTQVLDTTLGKALPGFVERFATRWDPMVVGRMVEREVPGVQQQPPEFLHPYKSSWFLPAATEETLHRIEARLKLAGVDATLVYSSMRDLDVLPRLGGKGCALIWLARHLGIPGHAIVVAGDSGNDSSMFKVPGVRGILVGNAHANLIEAVVGTDTYRAAAVLADGVLDGLRHYGVIPHGIARS